MKTPKRRNLDEEIPGEKDFNNRLHESDDDEIDFRGDFPILGFYPKDVHGIRPDWAKERVAEFMVENEDEFMDRMDRAGWRIWETMIEKHERDLKRKKPEMGDYEAKTDLAER